MPSFINKIGESYVTNEGYKVTIIQNLKANVKVLFEDNHSQVCPYTDLKAGNVKNLNHKSVYGIGFIGVGRYRDYQLKKIVKQSWYCMFDRCYSGKNKCYEDCTVISEWHCIQNFLEWFEKNYVEGWELDKDILVPGNKVYGPDTCCFVPKEINNLFKRNSNKTGELPTGVTRIGSKFRSNLSSGKRTIHLGMFNTIEEASAVYKIAKQKRITELAEKFKDSLSPLVYNTLKNIR